MFPELASLSKARWKEIWHECRPASWVPVWYWPVVLVWYGVGYSLIFWRVLRPMFGPTSELAMIGHLAIFFVALSFILLPRAYLEEYLRIRSALPEIRKRLGNLCLKCGYDLRATADRCPECGTAIPIPVRFMIMRESTPHSRMFVKLMYLTGRLLWRVGNLFHRPSGVRPPDLSNKL